MSIFSRQDAYIGIDIGTSSMKIIELRRRGKTNTVELVTYASANFMNVLVDGKEKQGVAQTATLVREMLQRAHTSSTHVVIALPMLSVFSAVLTLPKMPGRELEQAVMHAARNYVPTSLDDVVLGWTIIEGSTSLPISPETVGAQSAPATAGTSPQELSVTDIQAEESVQVFLTAAQRDLTQRYSEVVEYLGLQLVALEVESFPLSRSLLPGEQLPIMLVDIGDKVTSFSIVDRGYLRLNQSVDLGGASLTEALAQEFGLTPEEAERHKRAEGLYSSSQDGAVSPMEAPLRNIIERSQGLRRLYEQKSKHPIEKVILIGGGANLKGLTQFWTDVAIIPTEVGNPWQRITTPPVLADRLKTLGPSFAVAVGLALREF